MKMKMCRNPECKEFNPQPLERFSADKRSFDGKRERCKSCAKIYRQSVREFDRAREIKRKYGITIEQYDKMLKEQEGVCKICGNTHHRLNIDHCHSTGFVRGLLCTTCNNMLGMAKDSIKILKSGIKYLKDSK